MAQNRRTSKDKIDQEPNPSFSSEAKSPLEDIGRMLSSPGAGSAGKAGKFYGTMLKESFPPRAGSAVKKPAAKAASMLKEGGMVGRATGQGYRAARKGPNVV
jgi:hypothetical protein